MPFNGTGMFVRLRNWVADAAAGVKIRADYHDIEDDGFAAGLSQCIARDGQSVVINNIPMNGKRLTALQDPVDPQDASTKAYADTKLPLAGGTITGNVTIKNTNTTLVLDSPYAGANSIVGQKNEKNRWIIILGNAATETGGNAGSDFQLAKYADDGTTASGVLYGYRNTGLVVVAGDPTAAMGIATKNYVDNANATRLPLAGGTITGSLTVNGGLTVNSELVAAASYLRFQYSGSPGYIQWQGGGNYGLGGVGGGLIWHTGNLLPILNARLAMAADIGPGNGTMNEPYLGAVITGLGGTNILVGGANYILTTSGRARWLQLQNPNGWYTVATA